MKNPYRLDASFGPYQSHLPNPRELKYDAGMVKSILSTKFFSLNVEELAIFTGTTILLFVITLLFKKLLSKIFSRKSSITVGEVQKINLRIVQSTKPITLFFISLALSDWFNQTQLTDTIWIQRVLQIVILFQFGVWGSQLIKYLLDRYGQKRFEKDASLATSLKFASMFLQILLYSILILVGLDNMGVDVTTMVAGLGIGGIAIALAAQNILGDLFASLSIVLDKPFVLGDFIVVGDELATIEKIGLKTTRARSLSGEELVFPNSDLLSSRIRNYQRMQERRVAFQFGVIYQTPTEQLEEIPHIVKKIVEEMGQVRFDRAHFKSFGESSYDFEVVYWTLTPEYTAYMDAQQTINLELVKSFRSKSIDFAYPTRTVFLSPENEERCK